MAVQIVKLPSRSVYLGNCYLLVSGTSAALVDPTAETSDVKRALNEYGATLTAMLLTHAHYDHLSALYDADYVSDIPLYVHEADKPALASAKMLVAPVFGRHTPPPAHQTISVSDGDTIPLGSDTIRVWHTPGHTPGAVCYSVGDRMLTGDTLFLDSIGATRFPGGDEAAIYASLAKIKHLAPAHIYPGHGPDADFAVVCADNPFLRK